MGVVSVGVAFQVLVEDGLIENAARLEHVVRRELTKLDPAVAHTVRGRGLFFGIVIDPRPGKVHSISPGTISPHSHSWSPGQGSRHGMCA